LCWKKPHEKKGAEGVNNHNDVVHVTISSAGDLFVDEKYGHESGNCPIISLLLVYDCVDGNTSRLTSSLGDGEPNEEFWSISFCIMAEPMVNFGGV
jgi:hypothetical protein